MELKKTLDDPESWTLFIVSLLLFYGLGGASVSDEET